MFFYLYINFHKRKKYLKKSQNFLENYCTKVGHKDAVIYCETTSYLFVEVFLVFLARESHALQLKPQQLSFSIL